MKLMIVPVTPFQQNCSILIDEDTALAAVVDPGGDLDQIDSALQQAGVSLQKVLVTHGLLDHCGMAAEFARRHGVPIEGPHEADKFWIDQLATQGAKYGFGQCEGFVPSRWLAQGDTVQVGNLSFEVAHCPGHTPGHVVFFQPEARLAVVGDVLFQGSIGRTDFPMGNHQQLIDAITQRLWPMGDDVAFVPGHGPMSTFGDERKTNPFVSDDALA
ncbi:MAG: MBL fold metallo-hydrolase [Burkholderiales bacterium]